MVYSFFDKKTPDSGIKNENISNQSPLNLACVANVAASTREISEELHKRIIRKFKKRKVHSAFIDNIWGADLAGLQLIC